MGLVDGAIGFGEARLKKIAAIIAADVAGLNAALGRTDNADTSYLLGTRFGGDLTTANVMIGELLGVWDKSDGCMFISVTSGGHQTGEMHRSQRAWMDDSETAGRRYTYLTEIHCYFHPECWNIDAVFDMVKKREYAIERVADWLNWAVLNHSDNSDLQLESSCYNISPQVDYLKDCGVTSMQTGVFYRAFANNIPLYGVRAIHEGVLE